VAIVLDKLLSVAGYKEQGNWRMCRENIRHCNYYGPHEIFFNSLLLDLRKNTYIPEVSRVCAPKHGI